jgi:ubiquinone biosynthesis monooxygenase Coq7
MTKGIYPGDTNQAEILAQIIRVNQAGEYGAARIYAGQLAGMKPGPATAIVEHMQAQEQAHLDTFNKMLVNRRIRPTILSPIWNVAGFALGFITGKMGQKAAMACTVAVEEVIDQHYQVQEQILEQFPNENILKETVSKFRQEELEHRDIGLHHGAQQAPFYKLLCSGIKIASKTAIWLSKRI